MCIYTDIRMYVYICMYAHIDTYIHYIMSSYFTLRYIHTGMQVSPRCVLIIYVKGKHVEICMLFYTWTSAPIHANADIILTKNIRRSKTRIAKSGVQNSK